MDSKKIATFIKEKRKERGLTQAQLAEKLFVTEKAISRWETGRGTPDISLLIPLAKELGVSASELLSGEENFKNNDSINHVIEYIENNKKGKYNLPFKISFLCYIISIFIFLLYLRFEYNSNIRVDYFIRLFFVVVSSFFIILGNCIYCNNYVDTLKGRQKIQKVSFSIIAIYYCILLFNMAIFARFNRVDSYNLIPFKSIYEIICNGSFYSIVINIFGNFCVFIPVEYFLIRLLPKASARFYFIISLGIVLCFESIQYIFHLGVFDVDDILLCLSGMMGFFLFYHKYSSN